MKRLSKKYTVEFVVDAHGDSHELTGFAQAGTEHCFEPGWSINLLAHDIFEHWFENSDYFSTEQLSQAGECVAMGVRQWLYEHTGVIDSFMMFNGYHGVQWNSIATICGQITDVIQGYSDTYPNDFNFKHHPKWDGINNYEGLFDAGFQNHGIDRDDYEDIIIGAERAFSYGYWLGKYMFSDRGNAVYNFLSNLKDFMKSTGISSNDSFNPEMVGLDGERMVVTVGLKTIEAKFMGCKITSEQDDNQIGRQVRKFENTMYGPEDYK